MNLAGLILAAGASRRMGEPKALLDLAGETFLDRLIRVLGSRCHPVVVVLGYHAGRIRKQMRRAGEATLVVNPDPGRGQLSSLHCGLRAIPSGCEGVLFTPVDYPAIQEPTVSAIADTFRSGIVVPTCDGKRGHPVCVSREVVSELLTLDEPATARDVIHQWRDRTCYVEVDDRGILGDVDDPAAYRRLIGE